MPKVTVAMPVYQGERFLEEAMRSVLDQTMPDLHLVVCDDGSTDRSREIALKIAQEDNRVKVISQNHGGVSRALNAACRYTSSPYIAILDSDDVALEDRLLLQCKFLDEHSKCALVGGCAVAIDEVSVPTRLLSRPNKKTGLSQSSMLDSNGIIHSTVMMRRSAYEAVGGYRTLRNRGAEDYDLWLRICKEHEIDNLTSILSGYRIHMNQDSFAYLPSQLLSSRDVREDARHALRGGGDQICSAINPEGSSLENMGDEFYRDVVKAYLDYADLYLDLRKPEWIALALSNAERYAERCEAKDIVELWRLENHYEMTSN